MSRTSDDDDRASGFFQSASTRIALGTVLGAAIGGGIGLIAGLLWLPDRPGAVATAALGGALVGALLGAFWAGMSRLESPQPGAEPSQVDAPIREADSLTTEERTSPPPPSGEGGRR